VIVEEQSFKTDLEANEEAGYHNLQTYDQQVMFTNNQQTISMMAACPSGQHPINTSD